MVRILDSEGNISLTLPLHLRFLDLLHYEHHLLLLTRTVTSVALAYLPWKN